jgi:hypothetical protein
MKKLLIRIIRVQKGNFAIIYKMTLLPLPLPPAHAHPFELEIMGKKKSIGKRGHRTEKPASKLLPGFCP